MYTCACTLAHAHLCILMHTDSPRRLANAHLCTHNRADTIIHADSPLRLVTQTRERTLAWVHEDSGMRTHAQAVAWVRTFIHAHLHTHSRTPTYTNTSMHLRPCIHKREHINMCMCTLPHTHSWTQDIYIHIDNLCMHDTNVSMCMGNCRKSL